MSIPIAAEPEMLVIRPRRRRLLPAGFLAIAVVTALLHLSIIPSESLWLSAWFALMALLGFAVDRWFAVVLTPVGLTDRGLRTHRWTWSDIDAIDETANQATRYVTIRTVDGETTPLRLPTTLIGRPDDRFDRELALINQYWTAHR